MSETRRQDDEPHLAIRLGLLEGALDSHKNDTAAMFKHIETRLDEGQEKMESISDMLVYIKDNTRRMLENSGSCEVKVAEMYGQFLSDAAVYKSDAMRMSAVIKWGATIAAFGVILALIRWLVLAGTV